jgi:glycosyltransferase involved in cell wall biosynthesis
VGEALVSVLMACRNHEQYAAAAANSILERDYERLELVVVDDASDEATAAS